MKIGPKEAKKKENLRSNKEDYAKTKTRLNTLSVTTLIERF